MVDPVSKTDILFSPELLSSLVYALSDAFSSEPILMTILLTDSAIVLADALALPILPALIYFTPPSLLRYELPWLYCEQVVRH